MQRWFALAALLALAMPLAQAQRGMRAGPSFRGAPGVRTAPRGRPIMAPRVAPMPRGPMVRSAPRTGSIRRGFGGSGFTFGHLGRRRGGVRFRTVPFCDPSFISCQFILSNHFGRRGFSSFASPFGFGAFGAYGYPLFGDDTYPQTDYSQSAAPPASQPIIVYAQPPAQPAPTEAAPAPQPEAAPARAPEPMPLPPTVLVFRDQHREEVTNYAIAGDTVWIFSAQGRTKIALSDLDLPATVKVNDDRGVEFRVPPAKGS